MSVKSKLRSRMIKSFSSFVEAKNIVSVWWNELPIKKRLKVCSILGLSKKDAKAFEKLAPSTQSEIEAYYSKHKGKIESIRSFTAFKVLSEQRKG